jgi:DNA-binding LacI/PurR family transcriptional regulator
LVERAQERGIRIPGELTIVSYDDEVAAVALAVRDSCGSPP